jgi:hypothetical protein
MRVAPTEKSRKSVAPGNEIPEQSQADLGCPDGKAKIFCFSEHQIRSITRLSPRPQEGRNAIVTERWRGLRWTLRRQRGANRADENAHSVRRSRVVLAPRPWRYVGGNPPPATGARKAASPGRARISRKTIARGKPGCPGCTCSLTRVLSSATLAHGTAGAVGARLSLRPLRKERDNEIAKPGRNALRECGRTPSAV